MRYQKDIFFQDQFYHIYNKSAGNENVFAKATSINHFMTRYDKYFENYFSLFAFCFIPNHFHLLIKVKAPNQEIINLEKINASTKFVEGKEPYNFFIENQLSRFLGGFSLSYNKSKSRSGPVFKEGTKRVKIFNNKRLLDLLCYIHHNPIHHGFCEHYANWEFSSYSHYIEDLDTSIDTNEMLDFVGGKEAFVELHEQYKSNYKNNS